MVSRNIVKYAERSVVYNVFNFPITNFIGFNQNDQLYVPEYQRELVWDQEDKDYLIESIMMNMPIGNIFLNDRDSNHQYEVVDGQQRLDAIIGFYKNDYKWHGYYFKDLPHTMQVRFEMFSLATYITKYENRSEIIELYYRINWAGENHSLEELIQFDELRREGR